MAEINPLDIRQRHIALIDLDEETTASVAHSYISGPCRCPDCPPGDHPSPGFVSMTLRQTDGADEVTVVDALLQPEIALALANRLVRAASLVFEAQEDATDPDRELLRLTATADQKENR